MDTSNALEWVKGIATLGGLGVFIVLVKLFLDRQREGDRLILDVKENYSEEMKLARENFSEEMKLARETYSLDLRETRTAFATQLQDISNKFTHLQEAQIRTGMDTITELKNLQVQISDYKRHKNEPPAGKPLS